jgi:hypothetical protein
MSWQRIVTHVLAPHQLSRQARRLPNEEDRVHLRREIGRLRLRGDDDYLKTQSNRAVSVGDEPPTVFMRKR